MATATLNTTFSTIGAPQGAVGSIISHCAVWNDSSRTEFIMAFALTSTQVALTLGQTLNIAANAWVFTFTSSDLSDYGEVEALRGIFRADRYISWHTGSPGGSGSNNRESALTATLLDVSNIDFAE